MGKTLAILFTFTTYGTWLRGDARGWVDDGILVPPDPTLDAYDGTQLKHPPFFFNPDIRHFSAGSSRGLSDRARRVFTPG